MIIQSLVSNGVWITLGTLLGLALIAICACGLFEKKVVVKVEGQYFTPEERMQFYK